MPLKARQRSLEKFEHDDDFKILLMSNVGTVGLNVTRASVLIFIVSALAGLLPWHFD